MFASKHEPLSGFTKRSVGELPISRSNGSRPLVPRDQALTLTSALNTHAWGRAFCGTLGRREPWLSGKRVLAPS